MGKKVPKLKIIGVDLDGVIGNLTSQMVSEASRLFGVNIDLDLLETYKLEECTELTKEQVLHILSASNVFTEMKPFKDVQDYLNKISKKGWYIHIITDREEKFYDITKKWLNNYRFIWHNLSLINSQEKANFAKELKINVFVEDRFDTAVQLSSVCENVFLLDRSYNQGQIPKNVLRVVTWNEILDNLHQNASSR